MPLTNFADGYVALQLFGDVSFTPPSTWYLGLSSTSPTQASTNRWNFTEPTTQGSYGRPAVSNATSLFGPSNPAAVTGFQVVTLSTIAFPSSTGPWSTTTSALGWFGWFDSPTVGAGNLWGFGICDPAPVVNASATAVAFSRGQLTFEMS